MSKRIIIAGLAVLWSQRQEAPSADEADESELMSIKTKLSRRPKK